MVAQLTVIYRRPHIKKRKKKKKLLVTCCCSFGSTVITMYLHKRENLTDIITDFYVFAEKETYFNEK